MDVGAGNGNVCKLIKKSFDDQIQVDGIEVWQPYIEEYNLNSLYDNLYNTDVRLWGNWNYDLVIFGDVLEHMVEEESSLLWSKVSKSAKNAIITIPIIHYPQGAHGGNPFEVHHEEDWGTERILKVFPGIVEYKEFKITGAYLAKFT